MSLIHLIGTQAFLPALLAHIRGSATAPTVPIDHVILQSILLCLITGEKHLILRTPEEDVPLTAQLAAWTLSCIFDRPTRRLKIRPQASKTSKYVRRSPAGSKLQQDGTTAFLRSLLIQPGTSPLDEENPGSDNAKNFGAGSSHTWRSPPNQYRSRPGSRGKRPHSEHHAYGTAQEIIPESFANPSLLSYADSQSTTTPSIIRPKPMYPNKEYAHAYTDPFPLNNVNSHRRRKSSSVHAPPEPPHALVLSNLEEASDPVQRALARVLAEKKIVLPAPSGHDATAWELPEGFITVAVCPWSATERPALHNLLLDKFSMSANVFVSSSVRRDLRLLPFSLSSTRLQGSMASPGLDRVFSQSTPNSPARPSALPLPITQTPPPGPPSALPPHQPTYSFTPPSPLLSAHSQSHSHHSISHQRSATYAAPAAHAHPSRPLPSVFPSAPVTPVLLSALRTAYAHTRIAPNLSLYLADTLSATRAHPKLDALLLTVRAHRDAEDLVRAVRVVGTDPTGAELLRPSLDKSEPMMGRHNQDDRDSEELEGTEVEVDEEEDEDYQSALDVWATEGSATALGHGNEHEHAPLMSTRKMSTGAASTKNPSMKAQSFGVREAPVHLYESEDDDGDEWKGRWLDAAEVDVARVVPRVVSHRVRLRGAPQDEVLASAVFGATFAPGEGWKGEQAGDTDVQDPDSVKAVLVQILADV